MRRTFVESSSFSRRVDREDPGTLQRIQTELLKNPEAGSIIQATGGLRKLRAFDPARGKGKRGGYRVIYLDLPTVERTYLLALYNKEEKEDISPEEKRALRALVAILKKEAK